MRSRRPQHRSRRRRGTVLILVGLVTLPLLGMVAFATDYGYLLKCQADLQRAADATALAAVLDLEPCTDGTQDLEPVYDAVREYAVANMTDGFSVLSADIEIGRFEPATVYSDVQIAQTGIYDTVRVTLRRDASANGEVALFFANALGIGSAPITATATAALRKSSGLEAGSDVLPFAVPLDEWDMINAGDQWNIYGDGRILDSGGGEVPGNWGTVDIGLGSNSTDDLGDQILNGLRQHDLDALYDQGAIPTTEYIDAFHAMWLGADSGLSVGMKHDLYPIIGEERLIPIYDTLNDEGGDNMAAHIVRWGVVKVVDANFSGSKNSYLEIAKGYLYDADLRPPPDLSEDFDVIEGAFTSPVLLE